MDLKIIDDALDFVKEVFSTDFSGHDYFHTLRVYKMAVRIAQEEGANQEIVTLAALLHDVDDIKLSPETHENKDRAVGFLRQHAVDEATIQAICTVIDEVSFSGTDSVVPSTLEGMCVQDADRLDALGAVGLTQINVAQPLLRETLFAGRHDEYAQWQRARKSSREVHA